MSQEREDERLPAASLYDRVHALIDMGRYREALQHAAENVARDPEDSHAQCLLAEVHFMLEDYDAAFESASRAIEIDPNNDGALFRLAWCKLRFNAFTDALELAQAAVAIDPEYSGNLYLLAVAEHHCGHANKALAAARRGIELHPEHAGLHGLLGDLIFQIDKPKQALPHYREALKHDPENAGLHASLAVACAESGDIPAAVDCFVRAAKLDPQDDETRQKLFSILHHHLLNLPPGTKHEILERLGPTLAMFYQQALSDNAYANKLRMPSIVLLWMIGFLGFVFLIALATGDDISALGGLLVAGLCAYAALQLWQWLVNWRLQKKFLSDR